MLKLNPYASQVSIFNSLDHIKLRLMPVVTDLSNVETVHKTIYNIVNHRFVTQSLAIS
jgi:hypothetical protein